MTPKADTKPLGNESARSLVDQQLSAEFACKHNGFRFSSLEFRFQLFDCNHVVRSLDSAFWYFRQRDGRSVRLRRLQLACDCRRNQNFVYKNQKANAIIFC